MNYLGPVLRWLYHPNQKIRVYELHNRLVYLHLIISVCYLAIAVLRSVSNSWTMKHWIMKHWNMKQQWLIFLMSNRECLNEAGGEPWYMCADRDSVDKKIPYLNFSIIAPWMLSISAMVTACLHCHMRKHMAYEYYKQSGLVKTDRGPPGSNSESRYILEGEVTCDYLDSEHVFMNGIKILYWMEYSITAPLITAVVLYYSGVIEVRTHLICFASQATLMMCGYALDALRQIKNKLDALRQKEDTEKSPEWEQKFIPRAFHHIMAVGTINMLTVWLPPFVQLFTADRSPPEFVYILVVVEFALFGLFGVAQAYYTYGWKWKWKCCCSCPAPLYPQDDPPDDRIVSENETFAWLSALSKVSLAVLFMGFL